MTAHKRVKIAGPLIVGVIASPADLDRARRLRKPPNLFELRLDLLGKAPNEQQLSMLKVPLIVTARDPREGGAKNLSIQKRRRLLQRFLPHAALVDIELRSAGALDLIVDLARNKNIGVIMSLHRFDSTPSLGSLRAMARKAQSLGADVFKIVTRTDTPEQLTRLLDFAANPEAGIPLSIMGVGKLAHKSRRELIRRGSVLNYAHLGHASISGQPSLENLRAHQRT